MAKDSDRAAARDNARKAVKEDFEARKGERQAMTEETNRRMEEAKPTPTQDEVDEAVMSIAAGLGTIETQEENPVAEEDREVTPQSVGGSASYDTRDMAARRRPGRPRKVAADEGGSTGDGGTF